MPSLKLSMKVPVLNSLKILVSAALILFASMLANVAAQDAKLENDSPVNDSPKNETAEIVPQQVFQRPVLIEFNGPIDSFQNQLFQRKLSEAKKLNADLVVIEIHSPGGTVDDSIEIAKTLRDVDWAHTIAFIPEKALSGAALASLGCDEIVMSGSSRIGDAGVIFLDNDFFFKYAVEKIRSDVVRQGRDLAEAKGRSADIVEAMIDMEVLVFQQELPGGKLEFTSRRANQIGGDVKQAGGKKQQAADFKKPLDMNVWKLVPESDEKKFLIMNGPRAVELGFAQRLADDREELAGEFGLQQDFRVLKRKTSDTLAYWLNLPLISILLLAIGVIALLVEFSAPGISVGGVIATLCFGMFFWARFLGGTAGGLEVVLFVLGIAFLLLEFFVIPGFGVPGLLGMFLLVSSLVLASQDFVIPSTSAELGTLSTGLLSVMGVGVLSLIGGFFVTRYMGSIPVLSNLMLAPPGANEDSAATSDKSATSDGQTKPAHFPSVGEWGQSESVLRPSGKARFGNQTLDVVADGYVEEGVPVRVMDIKGNVIKVSSDA